MRILLVAVVTLFLVAGRKVHYSSLPFKSIQGYILRLIRSNILHEDASIINLSDVPSQLKGLDCNCINKRRKLYLYRREFMLR